MSRLLVIFAILWLFVGMTTNLYAGAKTPKYDVYISSDISKLYGYTQIPAGGRPGSSFLEKPTFDDLNLHHSMIYKFGGEVSWDLLGIYGDYQYMRPVSKGVFTADIKTHNVLIKKDSKIKTENVYDLYRLGINHKIVLYECLQLIPMLELTALNFSYQISTTHIKTSRAFHSATSRIGLGLKYAVTENMNVSGALHSSIPNSTNLQVQTANLTGEYIFSRQNKVTKSLILGGGYERIHFRDKQLLPNDFKLHAPYLEVGVKFSF